MPKNISDLIFSLFTQLLSATWPKKYNKQVQVATLLSHQHRWHYLLSITTLFWKTGQRFPTLIIPDGTLTANDKKTLQDNFQASIDSLEYHPEVQILWKKQAPDLFNFRFYSKNHILRKKIDVLFLCTTNKVILMDSDILFHHAPREILTWLHSHSFSQTHFLQYDSSVNQAFAAGHNPEFQFRKAFFSLLGISRNPSFNSGLILTNKPPHEIFHLLNTYCSQLAQLDHTSMMLAEELLLATLFSIPSSNALTPSHYLTCTLQRALRVRFTGKETMIHYAYETKSLIAPHFIRIALHQFFTQRKIS